MKKDVMPPYFQSQKLLKKIRRVEREKTKGPNWYDMPATEMTDERKNDLTLLKMRSVLDPKRFYKKNDSDVLPKFFQVGTVVEGPADFYHSRIPKKQRKQTIADELLADAEFQKYRKRNQPPPSTRSDKKLFKKAKRAKRIKKRN